MAESKHLAQGIMNGAGAIQRALDGYNAPGSVDYHQTLEGKGQGFQHASQSEANEWRKPGKNLAVARALAENIGVVNKNTINPK